MEEVLRATRAYITAASMRTQLEQIGWQILTNYVVRNADCHSKNIALYYTERSDVRFAPTYDIVTTQAYPRYATNAPGLSIEGRKTWAPGKSLEQFFKSRLGIAPRDYHHMAERVCESAVEVGREIIQSAKNDARRWRAATFTSLPGDRSMRPHQCLTSVLFRLVMPCSSTVVLPPSKLM
jgi:serine/threonine-protein kinase HipA